MLTQSTHVRPDILLIATNAFTGEVSCLRFIFKTSRKRNVEEIGESMVGGTGLISVLIIVEAG